MTNTKMLDGFKEAVQSIQRNAMIYNSLGDTDIEVDTQGLLHNIITLPISRALGIIDCDEEYKVFLFNMLYKIRLGGGVVVIKDTLKTVNLNKLTTYDIDINPLSDTYLYPKKIINTITGEDISDQCYLIYAFASNEFIESYQRGVTVTEHIKSAYVSYINALSASSKIITNMNTEIYKLEGLLDMIGDKHGLETLQERLKFINIGKSQSVVMIDAQDDFTVHSQSLGGVDKVILAHQINLCSVSQIPYSILFGKNTGGLNSNDIFDDKKFYDYVRFNLVERYIAPIMDKLGAKITIKDYEIKDDSKGLKEDSIERG